MTNGAPIRQRRRPIQNPILGWYCERLTLCKLQSADNVDCGLSLSS